MASFPLNLIGTGLVVWTVAGCQGTPSTPDITQPLSDSPRFAGYQSCVAMSTLTIDPVALSATIEAVPLRTSTSTGDIYVVEVSNFFRGPVMSAIGVERNGATLDLHYEVAHPFPAPIDPLLPPNGFSNRADLGFAGDLCFLVDVTSAQGHTFFTDRVANTSVIVNPSSYYSPEGLLPANNLTANLFPCQVLVDERGNGNRVGISNGGNPTGNYGTDGWTRAELGPDRTGWTGYGILHHGQTVRSTLSLDVAALGDSPIRVPVALLAKYNDPRGGATPEEKRANRLPAAVPDHLQFAYRMPHGSLDVERLDIASIDGRFELDTISVITLGLHLLDWDSRGRITSVADLAFEPIVTSVLASEAGLPDVALCIPGVLGDATVFDDWDPSVHVIDDDSAVGGDPGQDSGHPGDPLYYRKLVEKSAGSGQVAGTYVGFLRVSDPESFAATTSYVPLGSDLLPLTIDLPVPVRYYAFPVELRTPQPPSTSWVVIRGGTQREYAAGVDVTSDGSVIITSEDGLGFNENQLAAWQLTGAGLPGYDHAYGTTSYQLPYAVTVDADDNAYFVGAFTTPVDFGGGLRTPTTDRGDAYIMKLNPEGVYVWDYTCGDAFGSTTFTDVAVAADGKVIVCGYFSDGTNLGFGFRFAQGIQAGFALQLSASGEPEVEHLIDSTFVDGSNAIAIAPNGNIAVGGYFTETLIAGTETLVSAGQSDGYQVLLNPLDLTDIHAIKFGSPSSDGVNDIASAEDGSWIAVGGANGALPGETHSGNRDAFVASSYPLGPINLLAQYGGSSDEEVTTIGTADNGLTIVAGTYRDVCEPCTGSTTPAAGGLDAWYARMDAALEIEWSYGFGGVGYDDVASVALSDGWLVLSGTFESQVDFDAGPGLQERTSAGEYDVYVMQVHDVTGIW